MRFDIEIDIRRLKYDKSYWERCGAPQWATGLGVVDVYNGNGGVWFDNERYTPINDTKVFPFNSGAVFHYSEIRQLALRPTTTR